MNALPTMDVLRGAYAPAPGVAVRAEVFGALVYDYDTRGLSFLKTPQLRDVVLSLGEHPDVETALCAVGVAQEHWPAYAAALSTLTRSGVLVPRSAESDVPAGSDVLAGSVAVAKAAAPSASGAQSQPAREPESGTPSASAVGSLVETFESGLGAPICLTWELTYACNLACIHCLSSSGRRDPRELSTEQARAVIDEFAAMQVFYINIGGGEPTVRPDFFELVDYATASGVGVKFSTNGVRIDDQVAARIAADGYVDVQISLDGATAEVNDAVRGPGSFDMAIAALRRLQHAGMGRQGRSPAKISVVATRHNIPQLDEFASLATEFGATLRLTRLRPSGRGADTWVDLHPLPEQQRQLYDWLVRNGEGVLTGDSFFHLSAYGQPLPGLNLCGAGRVVCLIDPVGDVYACPFAIHETFRAGSVLEPRGFRGVWSGSDLFRSLREPSSPGACGSCGAYDACRGGCMAAKFFTGLPLDGPDPECVVGHGQQALISVPVGAAPRSDVDHSRRIVPVTIGRHRPPVHGCDEDPLAGVALTSVGADA